MADGGSRASGLATPMRSWTLKVCNGWLRQLRNVVMSHLCGDSVAPIYGDPTFRTDVPYVRYDMNARKQDWP